MAEAREAFPPAIDRAKSSFSSAPLPPVVRYTGSFMVTAMVLLSFAICTDDILGCMLVAVCVKLKVLR